MVNIDLGDSGYCPGTKIDQACITARNRPMHGLDEFDEVGWRYDLPSNFNRKKTINRIGCVIIESLFANDILIMFKKYNLATFNAAVQCIESNMVRFVDELYIERFDNLITSRNETLRMIKANRVPNDWAPVIFDELNCMMTSAEAVPVGDDVLHEDLSMFSGKEVLNTSPYDIADNSDLKYHTSNILNNEMKTDKHDEFEYLRHLDYSLSDKMIVDRKYSCDTGQLSKAISWAVHHPIYTDICVILTRDDMKCSMSNVITNVHTTTCHPSELMDIIMLFNEISRHPTFEKMTFEKDFKEHGLVTIHYKDQTTAHYFDSVAHIVAKNLTERVW